VIGSVEYDPDVHRAGFDGNEIGHCSAAEAVAEMIEHLEQALHAPGPDVRVQFEYENHPTA
jgi:hypothetical protein